MHTPQHLASALLVAGALLAQGCGDDRLMILTPALTIAPNPLVVDVSAGALGTAAVSIRNSGAGLLEIDAINLISPDGLVTLHEQLAPLRLMAGASANVVVDVDATGAAPADALLQVTSNAGSKEARVTTRITAGPAGCTLVAQPSEVAFTEIARGGSGTAVVTLQNTGDAACTLQRVGLGAGTAAAFAVTSLAGVAVAAGGSVVVAVTADVDTDAPAGAMLGSVVVEIEETADLSIPLRLVLDAPALCVTPTTLTFGALALSATRTVTLRNCGAAPLTVQTAALSVATEAVSLTVGALPRVLAVDEEQTVDVTVDPELLAFGSRTLVIHSDDPSGDAHVQLSWGAVGDETCGNGTDDDGDFLIDEDCVPGPAVGRAIQLGSGRLMLWGDEHVLFDNYGPATIAFWKNTLSWLGGPAPVVMLGGWLSGSDSLDDAAAELGAIIDGFDIATAGAGHVLVVQGPTSSAGIRAFVERGGGVLYLAVGIGSDDECVDGLDRATVDLPIRYSCEDPAPWGPVAALLPHPVTLGLGTDAVPFVNGRYVVEAPGAGSTVLAQP